MPVSNNLTGILIIMIIFMAPAVPFLVIGMVYYFKKKLDHKTLVAAIEKGVPVSELNLSLPKQKKDDGPGWVQDQSKGITLLIVGVGTGIAFWFLISSMHGGVFNVMWIIPIVFLGNGIGLLIRSKQRKKYEKPEAAEEEAE